MSLHPNLDLELGQLPGQRPGADSPASSDSSSGEQLTERQRSYGGLSSPHAAGTTDVGNLRDETQHTGGATHITSPLSQPQNARQRGPSSASHVHVSTSSGVQDPLRATGVPAHSENANYGAGEIFGDSSRRMWTLSLSEFEKYDKEITARWNEDTNGVLVFTGLFSATVAAFVIEGYKRLSVDSGDQTVALLTQMSQQLVGISKGEVLSQPLPLDTLPPNLTAATRINIMWLFSMAMSITCALLATLIQQWGRRYMALSYLHDMPHERARVRTYLFTGMEYFQMRRAVEAIPMLLHISVFLFFGGLVEFFFLFNKTVAWAFVGWVGLFGSAYTAMTVIPNVFLNCPYRTPFSALIWRLAHMLTITALVLMDALVVGLHAPVFRVWERLARGVPASIRSLMSREKLAKQITVHKDRFKKGLRESVVSNAIDSSSLVDREALIWTLTKLDEDQEVQDFVSRIPGFFDSRVVPEAPLTMLGLMDPSSSGDDSVLYVRLRGLLMSCLPTTSGLESNVRESRLHICLTAIWYYMKTYNLNHKIHMSKQFRMLFSDQNDMNLLLADEDPRTKIAVLCTGSLLVSKLMKEMGGQTENPQVSEGELVFLKKALGPLWRLDRADHKPSELTNLESMLGDLEKIAHERIPEGEALGTEALDTMHILAEDVVDRIASTQKESQGQDLSILTNVYKALQRCLSLSKQFGGDNHLGGLVKSDAMESIVRMLEGLEVQLKGFTASKPPPSPNFHSSHHTPAPGPVEGAQQSVTTSETNASPVAYREVLGSTLAELSEDDEFESFVARIPSLLGSQVTSDVFTMLDLMTPSSGGDSAFALRLHGLFKTSLLSGSSLGLDHRIRRLHICLAAILSYAKAYSRSSSGERPIPEHFRTLFADPTDMSHLLTDKDLFSRVTVLCISSLLATKVLEDVRSRTDDPMISEGELAFLERAFGPFWSPDVRLDNRGPMELVNLMAMLEGLEKATHQETSFDESLGREVSETLDLLATNVLHSLSDGPPPGAWGVTASAIGHSREALQRCLELLKHLCEDTRLGGLMKESAWMDSLVEKLNELSDKLAPPPSPYRLFHPHTPYTRVQSNSLDDMQSMNESVAVPSTESHPPGQAVLTLERQYMTMPEPTIYTGQQMPVPLRYPLY